MKLALRSHQLRWILPLELSLAIVGTLFGQASVYVPSFSGMGAVPVTTIAALVGVVALAFPVNVAWPSTRTTPLRSSSLTTIAALAVILAPTTIVCTAVGFLQPASSGFAYLGIFGWLLAMQLAIGALASGTYQAMAPVTYVLLCALLGRDDTSVQPWAWPLAGISGMTSLVVGSFALAVAAGLFAAMGLHRNHS